jgi:hypothetical protein
MGLGFQDWFRDFFIVRFTCIGGRREHCILSIRMRHNITQRTFFGFFLRLFISLLHFWQLILSRFQAAAPHVIE